MSFSRHFGDYKALLFFSLPHVSSAIASVHSFNPTFTSNLGFSTKILVPLPVAINHLTKYGVEPVSKVFFEGNQCLNFVLLEQVEIIMVACQLQRLTAALRWWWRWCGGKCCWRRSGLNVSHNLRHIQTDWTTVMWFETLEFLRDKSENLSILLVSAVVLVLESMRWSFAIADYC